MKTFRVPYHDSGAMVRLGLFIAVLHVIFAGAALAQSCDCPEASPSVSQIHVWQSGDKAFVSGLIVDVQTERPLFGAIVKTHVNGETGPHGTLTDSTGWFKYAVPLADTTEVLVQYIGYKTSTLRIPLNSAAVRFVMLPAPIALCGGVAERAAMPRRSGVLLTVRDIRTGLPPTETISLTGYEWTTQDSLKAAIHATSEGVRLPISSPGVFSIRVEAGGYVPWHRPKLVVINDDCDRTFIADQRITAWVSPPSSRACLQRARHRLRAAFSRIGEACMNRMSK